MENSSSFEMDFFNCRWFCELCCPWGLCRETLSKRDNPSLDGLSVTTTMLITEIRVTRGLLLYR